MKRFMVICLSVFLLFGLASCGNEEASQEISEGLAESSDRQETEEQSAITETEQEDNTMQVTDENISASEESGGKTLIAYFSLVDIVPEGADASAHATPEIGNTESAAMEIQAQVGGDLFAIKTVQTIPPIIGSVLPLRRKK